MPIVPEKYQFPSKRCSESERVMQDRLDAPMNSRISKEPENQAGGPAVSHVGAPSVSHTSAFNEARNDKTDSAGKRQALTVNKDSNNFTPDNCPTTKNTREQLRADARPGEYYMSSNYPHEQLRNENICETIIPTHQIYDSLISTAREQTRNPPARSVEPNETSQPPHQSETSQRNPVILPHIPVYPTQQQLAARQSLPKELPRFSGDPADWPVFLSSYNFTNEACGWTNAENMLRLQRCLTGDALDAVRSRLVLPATVPQVIETLRMRYGRPELLINTLLNKVRAIPAPRPDKLEGLIDLGMAVQTLVDHMEAAEQHAHLSNPSLLQELVAKLPANQKLMWAGYKRGFRNVDLRTFSGYMMTIVEDASSVVNFESSSRRDNTRERSKTRGFVHTHSAESSKESSSEPKEQPKQFECGICSEPGHRVRDCGAFKTLSVDDRWRRVRALGLCQVCLFNHGRRGCRIRKICDIEGCQFRHHPLLHSSR